MPWFFTESQGDKETKHSDTFQCATRLETSKSTRKEVKGLHFVLAKEIVRLGPLVYCGTNVSRNSQENLEIAPSLDKIASNMTRPNIRF